MTPLTRVRSLLFMPGLRADMVAKIPRFAPDVAAVDLEDAVAAGDKSEARRVAVQAVDELDPGDTVVLVRVNPVGTPWFADDVAAAAGSAAAGIVVPKLSTVEQVVTVRDLLAVAGSPSAVVLAGVETALGVADARPILAAGIDAAYFGAEDFIADMGGRRTAGGAEVGYARAQVCLAARLAGVPAIDQAVVALGDPDSFQADASAGIDLGYHGKICIHPSQVALAHQVFTPSAAQVEHARAVVAAARSGVAVVDGEMIDDVHARMAQAVLARAGEQD